MKKLGRKLVLSSLSLGLAVVTLSTTTYAWYTNNTTVSATGAQGTTSATTEGSLLISADGSTWSGEATLGSTNYSKDGKGLKPLQLSSGALVGVDGNAVTPDTDAAEYLQFSIYVKTTSSTVSTTAPVKVYLENLTITNTATASSDLTAQSILKNYSATTGDDWDSGASTYAVDATRALSVAFASQTKGANKGTTIGNTEYSVNGICGNASLEAGLGNNPNALDYYNAVMGTTLTHTSTATELAKKVEAAEGVTAVNVTAVELASLESANAYEIIVTVWLDGWDQYCFDACRGQSFNIEMSFTTDSTKAQVGPKVSA